MKYPQTVTAVRSSIAVLLAFALVSPLAAQRGSKGKQEDPFAEFIEVRVVNLEAVVTDASGERVSGLGPEDFRLRVDGKQTPIQFFTEVSAGRAAEGEEAGAVAAAPETDPGETVPINYLVFIDRLWAFEADQERLLGAMTQQLASLRPEDRMAVVSYGGGRIETLVPWTRSRGRLEAALKNALTDEFEGIKRFAEEWRFQSDDLIRQQYEQEGADRSGEAIDSFAENPDLQPRLKKLHRQMDLTSRAIAATMQAFSTPPGRKVMLLLSGGWIESFPNDVTGGRPQEHLFRITDTANLLGYTLYPVDTPMTRFGNETQQHASLDFLAEKTGGEALKAASGLQALDRVAADADSYYWLGFSPTWKGDGRSHDVKLEVLRPGLKVRTQEDFQDVSREHQVTELLDAAVKLGSLPSTDPIGLDFGEPQAKRKRFEVPVTLTIPMDRVTMLEGPEGYTCRLELRIAAIDEKGGQNDIPVIPLSFSNPLPPEPGQYVRYDAKLMLKPQKYDVVVALYDLASGVILSGQEKLEL